MVASSLHRRHLLTLSKSLLQREGRKKAEEFDEVLEFLKILTTVTVNQSESIGIFFFFLLCVVTFPPVIDTMELATG